MKISRFGFIASVSAASFVAAIALISTSVQADDAPSPFKFDVHGIVGASMYVQSNPDFLLNGQGPLLLRSQNNAPTTGFDVRQSRLSFSVTGPVVLNGATPKAVIEADFFGLDSAGAYGEVSALQRLRLAYTELDWGTTWIRVGQDWELLHGNSPVSLGHMAYSPTWFAGQLGWREPGVTAYHKMALKDNSYLESALQLIKSDWANPYGFTAATSAQQDVDSGQLSGFPGVEARLRWVGDNAEAYVVGHWNHVDGSRNGSLIVTAAPNAAAARDWDVVAGKVGAKYQWRDFTVLGEAYVGKNTAAILGEQATFYTLNDVHEAGGWAQVAYNFTPELTLAGLFGTTHSNEGDVSSAATTGGGAYQNTVMGGILQYKSGGFAFGPEIYHVETKSVVTAASGVGINTGTGAPDGVMDGMQYMMSAQYFF